LGEREQVRAAAMRAAHSQLCPRDPIEGGLLEADAGVDGLARHRTHQLQGAYADFAGHGSERSVSTRRYFKFISGLLQP